MFTDFENHMKPECNFGSILHFRYDLIKAVVVLVFWHELGEIIIVLPESNMGQMNVACVGRHSFAIWEKNHDTDKILNK